MFQDLFLTGGIAVLALAAMGAFEDSIPVVHKSYSSQQCVRVVPITAGSCDNLPEKFTLIWTR